MIKSKGIVFTVLLAFLAVCTAIFTVCYTSQMGMEDIKPQKHAQEIPKDYIAGANLDDFAGLSGAPNGNIHNAGIAVQGGDYIFFMNYNDSGTMYRCNLDGSDPVAIRDAGYPLDLNAAAGWVFYRRSGAEGGDTIWKMRYDGTELMQICDDPSYNIILYDGWIYYRNLNENSSIYKIDINGEGRHCISSDNSAFLTIYKEKLYYTNIDDDSRIYCIDLDGRNYQKISEDSADYIDITQDVIYYSNPYDAYHLYAINTDGTQSHRVLEQKMRHIGCYFDDGRVFMVSQPDWWRFNVMNGDGTGLTNVLSTMYFRFVSVAGDYFFSVCTYEQPDGSYKNMLVRVKHDGTELTVVEGGAEQ